jgi:rhodanese-related sulfurtransferase
MTELLKTAWGMAEAAEEEIETVDVDQLEAELDREGVVVVDIRDIREVWIEGSIPEVKHAPRGMIEFWADPETEYYRDFFDPDQRYICYCRGGGRSALAAKRLKEMGYDDVAHLSDGFGAWKDAGKDIVDVPQKDYKK